MHFVYIAYIFGLRKPWTTSIGEVFLSASQFSLIIYSSLLCGHKLRIGDTIINSTDMNGIDRAMEIQWIFFDRTITAKRSSAQVTEQLL